MGELNVGDVVQLKSGGPKMTVSEVGDARRGPYCIWFEGSEKKGGTFPAETLRKIEETT